MEVWGSIPNGGIMKIRRSVYEDKGFVNNLFQGVYQLFKYNGEYWWGYIPFSLSMRFKRTDYESLIIRKGRKIDVYNDFGGFDYAFKFEEGDI